MVGNLCCLTLLSSIGVAADFVGQGGEYSGSAFTHNGAYVSRAAAAPNLRQPPAPSAPSDSGIGIQGRLPAEWNGAPLHNPLLSSSLSSSLAELAALNNAYRLQEYGSSNALPPLG